MHSEYIHTYITLYATLVEYYYYYSSMLFRMNTTSVVCILLASLRLGVYIFCQAERGERETSKSDENPIVWKSHARRPTYGR